MNGHNLTHRNKCDGVGGLLSIMFCKVQRGQQSTPTVIETESRFIDTGLFFFFFALVTTMTKYAQYPKAALKLGSICQWYLFCPVIQNRKYHGTCGFPGNEGR